jgi:RNA recognition motif-containing protein
MQTTIVVRDIPIETTDEEFSTHFDTAVSTTLKRNKQGICRGFAFCIYNTKEKAEEKINEINAGKVTPFGILRAELSNGGKRKKDRQKHSKKKPVHVSCLVSFSCRGNVMWHVV